MKLKPVFKNAQIGDTVYSIILGEGVVTKLHKFAEYPVAATFACIDDIITFTYEGKRFLTDSYPELYWQKPSLPEQTERSVREINWLKVPIDTPVVVSNADVTRHRHFVCYVPCGISKYLTFTGFSTQKSSVHVQLWEKCRFPHGFVVPEEWYL